MPVNSLPYCPARAMALMVLLDLGQCPVPSLSSHQGRHVHSHQVDRSRENDIIKQAKLAGFSDSDLILMDNQYDSVIGLKNADIMLSKRPDFFIEFQSDAKVNSIVSAKFTAAGIPLLAIDVPVPGAPFMGVNNWGVALMGGEYMAKMIKEQWGGWDAVDMVVLGGGKLP